MFIHNLIHLSFCTWLQIKVKKRSAEQKWSWTILILSLWNQLKWIFSLRKNKLSGLTFMIKMMLQMINLTSKICWGLSHAWSLTSFMRLINQLKVNSVKKIKMDNTLTMIMVITIMEKKVAMERSKSQPRKRKTAMVKWLLNLSLGFMLRETMAHVSSSLERLLIQTSKWHIKLKVKKFKMVYMTTTWYWLILIHWQTIIPTLKFKSSVIVITEAEIIKVCLNIVSIMNNCCKQTKEKSFLKLCSLEKSHLKTFGLRKKFRSWTTSSVVARWAFILALILLPAMGELMKKLLFTTWAIAHSININK